ncbi:hypothetical protein HDV05_002075, partial [Chytridiales sp. JEL 0842]
IVSSLLSKTPKQVWKPSEGRSPDGKQLADSKEAALVFGLARALLGYGAPLYRVEHRVHDAAEALGLPCSVMCMPNAILISVGDGSQTHPSRTHFLRVQAGFHMGKLHEVDKLARRCFEVHKDNPFKTLQLLETVDEPAEFLEEDRLKDSPPSAGSEFENEFEAAERGEAMKHRMAHIDHQKEEEYKTPTTKFFEKQREKLKERAPSLIIPPHQRRASDDSVDTILKELDKVVAEANPYQNIINILAPAVVSGCLSVLLFPGSPADMLLAFTFSIFVGLSIQFSDYLAAQGSTEVLIAIAISFMSRITERLWPGNQQFITPGTVVSGPFGNTPVCFFVYSFTSMAQLLPGTQITLGMLDLSQNP